MYKKTLLACLLFFGYFCAWAQTERLAKVPGTKCSIVLPDGFVEASSFGGFQDVASGASIMVSEVPTSYQSIVKGFTSDALKLRGMTLIEQQTVTMNKTAATLFFVKQTANGLLYLKQILVFGDKDHTVLVNGIYPESSKAMEAKIKKSLLTTVYDPVQVEDPLAAATFLMDTKGTDFAPVKYMAGSVIYSTDGQIVTEKPTLIVGNSLAKVLIDDRKKYAENRLMQLPGGEQSLIKQINKITIDNLDGYEIIADGKSKNNQTERIYQTMLFTEENDQYYLILGYAKNDIEKYTTIFQKIAQTFKRKSRTGK